MNSPITQFFCNPSSNGQDILKFTVFWLLKCNSPLSQIYFWGPKYIKKIIIQQLKDHSATTKKESFCCSDSVREKPTRQNNATFIYFIAWYKRRHHSYLYFISGSLFPIKSFLDAVQRDLTITRKNLMISFSFVKVLACSLTSHTLSFIILSRSLPVLLDLLMCT